MESKSKSKNSSSIIAGIILLAIVIVIVSLNQKSVAVTKTTNIAEPFIKTTSAAELNEMFVCSCCGKTISECTCGMAKERKAYIDGLVEGQTSEEEAVAAYVKKYGLNSFIDENQKDEFRNQLIAQAPATRPIITLSPDQHDLGDISQADGTTSTIFELKNEGQRDLVINNIETSCGCTSASIILEGKEGPVFAMPGHGVNEKIEDWQIAIPAGATAQLKVYYDPNVHEDFRGTAIRGISIFSNDPIDIEKTVKIELNQVD